MRIGELSRRTGASVRALRHYEERGLLRPARGDNGYREYDDSAVTVVRNVRALLDHGLGLEDIAVFGACLSRPTRDVTEHCLSVTRRVYEHRLASVEARIHLLANTRSRLRGALEDLRARLPPASP